MYALEIKNISKEINGQQILKNVSFNIKKGEIYGFLGQNGAGKSTLMKVMFNLLKADSGEVTILGEKVEAEHPAFGKVSVIIETPIFYQNLTVAENLDIHCDYMGKEYKKNTDKILQLVGLGDDVKKKKARDLSLGMKQRLALGRAILCKPEILVLDEPINGLDPKGVIDIRELLLMLKEQGMTILISSHIIAEIEKVVDRIGFIHEGEFIEELTMEQIQEEQIDLEGHFINILNGDGGHVQ
jgi:ABC-2 type transport system ATP-binding protein